MTDFAVAVPVRENEWCLPLWFQSLRENVPVDSTGLIFLVSSTDQTSREEIARHADDFAWVTIKQDPHRFYGEADFFKKADSYNRLLGEIYRSAATWACFWPPDLLVLPGTFEAIVAKGLRAATAWIWLNREPPTRAWHGERLCEYNESVKATAMAWTTSQMPVHYPGEQFEQRCGSTWQTDVILGLQLLHRSAYTRVNWQPCKYGEFLSINKQLEQIGIDRWCYGDEPGLRLRREKHELELGWPDILSLTDQRPLQCSRPKCGDDLDLLGLYEVEAEA